MCGRFSLTHSADDIQALFELQEMERHELRYNIAPTQPVLIVMAGDGSAREPGTNFPDRHTRLVRWGLIPSWVKDPREFPLLINARSETAAQKASFRGPMRHWRVLIPASGFYEWKREGRQKPQAYWVRPRDGSLVAFAGVMDSLLAADGSQVETAAVLTTKANAALNHIHHRMPVVIPQQDFSRWLDCRNFEPRQIADLLAPVDPDFFEAVPVSDKVNKATNMGPDLQDPIEISDDGSEKSARSADTETQMSLF